MLTMKIKFDAYQQILQQQQPLTPETGGILGGDGTTIFTFEPDKGLPCGKMCSYAPDVQHLNRVIREWECSGTEFMGIYHIHFHNVCTLSQGDKKYIESILLNMPPHIKKLFFPLVVMPERKMICYYARTESGKVIIEQEPITIIHN